MGNIPQKVAIAVFISGSGTNLRTIAEFCQSHPHIAKIDIVISNKANIRGLEIAQEFGIPSIIITTSGKTMSEFEKEAIKYLHGISLICLAGFMRILTPEFIKTWHRRIINIHPSLLPSFKGANAIEDAIAFGVKITGCTVHFADAQIDSGPIIHQCAVEITPNDDISSLKKRIQEAEKICYTKALESILLSKPLR